MDYRNKIVNQFAADHHIARSDTKRMLEALVIELELLKNKDCQRDERAR